MTTAKAILVGGILLLGATNLFASGPVGVYGIIEKVVFEPNEKDAQRIQIWGAFAFVDGGVGRPGETSTPQYGYLYFTLPPEGDTAVVRTEWSDLKSVAGRGQAVGFGNWGYIGAFAGLAKRTSASGGQPPYFLSPAAGRPVTDVRIRPKSETPASPAVYSTNTGIVQLPDQGSHAAIVMQLREALKAK
jgi:hypothetical protein